MSPEKRRSPYIRLLRYLLPHTPSLVLSIVFTIMFAMANVYFMPLVKDILSHLGDKNLEYFTNHIINAAILFSIWISSKYAQVYLMQRLSYKILIQLRLDLFKRLQQWSMDQYSGWKLGDIVTRALSDVDKVKMAVMLNFESILPNFVTVVGISGYLFWLYWPLATLALVGVPAFIYILVYFSKRLKRVTGQIQRQTAGITHILQENVSNMKVVQAFAQEDHEMQRFEHEHNRNFNAFMREIRYRVTQEPLLAILQFIVFLGLAWYGGFLVVTDVMSSAELGAFFTGVILLAEPTRGLSKAVTKTHQTMASAERIFEILDVKSSVTEIKNAKIIEPVMGKVEFRNVCFSYATKDDNALNNINFTAESGQRIALVGLSGGGKSTLVNLIPRFYDPQEGEVIIDDVNIKEWSLKCLRSNIGIVPQDVVLFRGTILENIRYGNLKASQEDIQKAMAQANVLEFVEKFPDNILTKVGDQGQLLSGGQKQRISIARALLKNPKILILDEATSALDSESEHLVQEALDKLMQGRTTFVIAHRLSTIQNADKIIVINEGEIVETGTHRTLLENPKGQYTRLYELQLSRSTNK
ncbi:MAG: ABC transporter ATP-binding protein [bacterium]|nr:ABC transporter ATP-binding protein [bacterium]